ncbi:MAG TPA: hypothetical protein VGE67_11115 [Haloferula sp.]
MADKREFTFHLKTTGDPSGAKVVETAIDNVAEATESLGTSTSGGTVVLERDLRKTATAAQAADKAVEALENSIEQLNEEIEKNKSLTNDQVANLKRVADGGERLIKVQREQKSSSDAASKSTANLGMGALAAAQAFEDMQYGIRGVLNNIPQMVLMFGGGAGLAAVISVASVAGNLLFEKLTKGAAKATEDQEKLNDELAESLRFYRALSEAELRSIEARGKAFNDRLALAEKEAKLAEKKAGDQDSLESLKQRRAADLAIAKEKLELAREEARLVAAGGDQTVAINKAREAGQQRILAIEKQVTELIHEQELSVLRRKVSATEEQKATAGQGVDNAQRHVDALSKEVQSLAEQLNASQSARFAGIKEIQAAIENVQGQIDDIRAGNRSDLNANQQAVELTRLQELLETLPSRIPALLETPGSEKQLSSQGKARSELLAEARKNLDDATSKWGDIATSVEAAAADLKTATERLAVQRESDQEIQRTEVETKAVRGPDRSPVIDALGNVADQLEGTALADVAAQLRGVVADRVLTDDELAKTQVLLGQYFAQVARLGSSQNNMIREAMTKVDDLEREVRTLRNNQSNAVPSN